MKDTIVLHHTDNPSAKPQAKGVIALHLQKFGQRGAYHYLIEITGEVVQFHDEEFIGYHAGHWATNIRSVGICLAGDFTRHQPTDIQVLALTQLMSAVQNRWGIPDSRVKLHREIKATACPGTDLRQLAFARRKKLLEGKALRIKREMVREPERKNRLTMVLARILKAIG